MTAEAPGRAQLARRAGVVSAAVLASRILGLAARAGVRGRRSGPARSSTPSSPPSASRTCCATCSPRAPCRPPSSPPSRRSWSAAGEAAAWRLASLVVNTLAVVVGALCLLGIWFAPAITRAIAPGLRRHSRQARAHGPPDAHHVPLSPAGRAGGRRDGHPQHAQPLRRTGRRLRVLQPGLGRGRTRVRRVARARVPRRRRSTRMRGGAVRRPIRRSPRAPSPAWPSARCSAASSSCSCSCPRCAASATATAPSLAPRDPALRQVLRLMAPGDDRRRRGAGERVRQQQLRLVSSGTARCRG